MCNDDDNYSTIQYADINGDGLTDLCYRSDQGIRCYPSDGTTFTTVGAITTSICANESLSHGVCNDADNYSTIRFVDMNADGLADLVYRSDAGMRIWHSTGSGFNLAHSGDICANESSKYGICNDGDNYNSLQFADINGDALSDLCYRGDQGVHCHLGDGSGFSNDVVGSGICANGWRDFGDCNDEDNHTTIQFADMNADGLSDLIYRSDAGMRVWHSTGEGFSLATESSICANGSQSYGGCNDNDNYDYLQLADVNGDSYLDICFSSTKKPQSEGTLLLRVVCDEDDIFW